MRFWRWFLGPQWFSWFSFWKAVSEIWHLVESGPHLFFAVCRRGHKHLYLQSQNASMQQIQDPPSKPSEWPWPLFQQTFQQRATKSNHPTTRSPVCLSMIHLSSEQFRCTGYRTKSQRCRSQLHLTSGCPTLSQIPSCSILLYFNTTLTSTYLNTSCIAPTGTSAPSYNHILCAYINKSYIQHVNISSITLIGLRYIHILYITYIFHISL